MTSTATPNATSSPGSADGHSQLGLPGFPLIGPSGRGPARASRSRSPAKAPVSTIHGTCGPTSFASSPPVGPLSSWENRLRARLAMVGSTECSLIWRVKATPAGGSISRLAPWTPPTSASGSTGSQSEAMHPVSAWPTPDASLGGADPLDRKTGVSLQTHMARGNWPTPQAQVGLPNVMKGACTPTVTREVAATTPAPATGSAAVAGCPNTPTALPSTGFPKETKASTWSTPRASDGEKGSPNQSFGAGGQPLPAQMHSASPWVTPSARDWKDSAGMARMAKDGRDRHDQLPRQMCGASGPDTTGSSATTARPAGSPNPAFPCWLMGFPTVWLSGADSAMPSSRNSRRK